MSSPLQRLSIPLSDRSSHFGLLAIVLAALLWSIAAIVARRLFESGVSPSELAMARAVIAAIGLGAINQLGKPQRKWWDWRIFALGISLALVTVTYYVAIDRLSVAVALVIQYTAPAIVVAITALRTRRFPSLITVGAVLAAMLGVALISGVGGDHLQMDGLGLFAAGMSAVCFASYTLLSEAAVHTYGAIGVMARAFLISGLFWIAFQMSQGVPEAVFIPSNLLGILFVGVGGTLVPFSLLCWGIQQVQAEKAVIAATLEPVIATGLAWIWLDQSLSGMQLIGGLLVLVAVVSLQLSGRAPS